MKNIQLNVIDLDLERISSVAPIPHISGDKLNYESLRLVPHPYSWTSSAGVCNLCPPINVFFDDNSIIQVRMSLLVSLESA